MRTEDSRRKQAAEPDGWHGCGDTLMALWGERWAAVVWMAAAKRTLDRGLGDGWWTGEFRHLGIFAEVG